MKRFLPLLSLALAGFAIADEPTDQAVKANSDFAFKLYAELARENPGQNLFFSPFSVSSALAMTTEGARGDTALEMGEVLGFPESIKTEDRELPWSLSDFHAGMASLNARLNGERAEGEVAKIRADTAALEKELARVETEIGKARSESQWKIMRGLQDTQRKLAGQINALRQQVDQFEASVANALWAEKTYPFRDDYFATIARFYGTGGIRPVDFRGNADGVGKEINAWVEEQTRERIKELIPAGTLSQDTRLVLVNAIYFKGDWSVPFETDRTQELDFTRADGKSVKHPIMQGRNLEVASYAAFNGDGSFFKTPARVNRGETSGSYPDREGFAMLALPYRGGALSMLVIAPNDPGNLAAIEDKLNAASVAAWIDRLEARDVNVFLPRFKSGTTYTLADSESPGALQKMGMERAFIDPRFPNGANFDGMSQTRDPRDRLFLSKVIHKAFVEVNEKGTEAAAATAVIAFQATSLPVTEPFTPTFKADRPFIYLIRDNETGNILFLGRMSDPASE